jgi:PhnB protein
MSIAVTNHINFRGEARKALEFYKSVFGGDIAIVTYEDAHSSGCASTRRTPERRR